MSKTYSDYLNKTAITVTEDYIDVKTGESRSVKSKVQDEIEYHTNNGTLIHLVLSALNDYLAPRQISQGGTKEILMELSELKRILVQGYEHKGNSHVQPTQTRAASKAELNMKDIQEVLEAFGG